MASKRAIQSQLLALQFQNGSASALEELIALWQKPLFYFIRRLVESEEDAWDVLQEVWLAVMRDLPKLKQLEALPTWLYRIARNQAITRYRQSSRIECADDPEMSVPSNETHLDEKLNAANAFDVHNAIQSLSLPHREVITLHFLENFTLAEIAGIVDVSVGTVKSRLHYAKKFMRDALEEKNTKGERRYE